MILIMLGSSQDLNMKHKEERTTILLRLWTRSPGVDYSRITAEAGMVMKKPPVMISPSGRVPEQSSVPRNLVSALTAATGLFVEKLRTP